MMAERRATEAAAGLRIRLFRPADLSRILRLELAAFPEEPYSGELLLDLYNQCGALFFVASLGRRIVAYISTCDNGRRAEIVSIAVDPDARRRGIGAALMRHTLEELRRSAVHTVDLTVRTQNHNAIQFYRCFGFRYLRTMRRYYQDGGAGLRMRLSPL